MRKIMRNTCNPSKPLLDFEKAKAYRNQASLIYDKDFKLGFKGEKNFSIDLENSNTQLQNNISSLTAIPMPMQFS